MDRKNTIILIIALCFFGYQNITQGDFRTTPPVSPRKASKPSATPFPFSNLSYVLPARLHTLKNLGQESLPSPTPHFLETPTPPLSSPVSSTTPAPSPLPIPSMKPHGVQSAGDTTASRPTAISKESSVLLQTTENTVRYASRADVMLPMASLTKLMTAALVLEYGMREDTVIISERAENSEGDIATLRKGDIFSVHALLEAMLITSSNDAAIALEDYFREKGFDLVSLMNAKARTWGLENTIFKNPTGLDEIGHHSTAKDLALLTQRLVTDSRYDTLWEITRKKESRIVSLNKNLSHTLENSNKLLDEFPFIRGGKTGKTVQAGECLILILEKNTTKYILVILGSEDRFKEARALIEKYL